MRDILAHLVKPPSPPHLAPERGPPLCKVADAAPAAFDPHAQPAADYEFDQRNAQ